MPDVTLTRPTLALLLRTAAAGGLALGLLAGYLLGRYSRPRSSR